MLGVILHSMKHKNGHTLRGLSYMNADLMLYLFFSPKGRISRKQFILGQLILAALTFILVALFDEFRSTGYYADLVVAFIGVVCFVMLCIKRTHDLDRSGHFCWLLLIPIVNLWPLVMMISVAGSAKQNRFGLPVVQT